MTTFQTIPSHTSMYQNETMYIMYITWPIGSHDTRPSSRGVTWPCAPNTYTLCYMQYSPTYSAVPTRFRISCPSFSWTANPKSAIFMSREPFRYSKIFSGCREDQGRDWGRKGKVRERKGAREEGRILSWSNHTKMNVTLCTFKWTLQGFYQVTTSRRTRLKKGNMLRCPSWDVHSLSTAEIMAVSFHHSWEISTRKRVTESESKFSTN